MIVADAAQSKILHGVSRQFNIQKVISSPTISSFIDKKFLRWILIAHFRLLAITYSCAVRHAIRDIGMNWKQNRKKMHYENIILRNGYKKQLSQQQTTNRNNGTAFTTIFRISTFSVSNSNVNELTVIRLQWRLCLRRINLSLKFHFVVIFRRKAYDEF